MELATERVDWRRENPVKEWILWMVLATTQGFIPVPYPKG